MINVQRTQEIDDEIYQVYKLFDRDGNGVSAENLCSMMNKLLELKQEQQFAQYGITSESKTPSSDKIETESKIGQSAKDET